MNSWYEIKLIEGASSSETPEVLKNNRRLQQQGFIGTTVGPHGRHWWRTVCDGKTITYLHPKTWNEDKQIYEGWEVALKYEIVQPKRKIVMISCCTGNEFSYVSLKGIKMFSYKICKHFDLNSGAEFSAVEFIEI